MFHVFGSPIFMTGLYAAAFAFELILGEKEADHKMYENSLMRTHLANCLIKEVVEAFPLADKQKRGRRAKEKL